MAASPVKTCPVCKATYGGGEVFCPVDGGRLGSPSQMPRANEPKDPLVGVTLGERYLVRKRVGEGGMGIVYAGQHVVIDKRVAIKVLREDFSRRQDVVERFRQEAKSASRIANPHIVDISDFGETPHGDSYFVMEFLEGEDLSRVLARESTLKPERAIRIALQCCDALGAAHEAGIVHRDMKPENVFLVKRSSEEDFVKIVDFGIAKMNDIETDGAPGRKLTKTGMIFGTPEYMSPEQASGKELDHRVDVYAMGVILFECMTGRVPFVGDTFMGILTQQMFEPPPPLREVNPSVNCPPALEQVITKALAKSPDERFQNMAELAAALRRCNVGEADRASTAGTFVGYGEPVAADERNSKLAETPAVKASSFPPPAARQLNKGLWIGIGVAAAVALVGGGVVLMREPSQAEPETPTSATPSSTTAPESPTAVEAPSHAETPTAELVRLDFDVKPTTATLVVEGFEPTCSVVADQKSCFIDARVGAKLDISVSAPNYETKSDTGVEVHAGLSGKRILYALSRKRASASKGAAPVTTSSDLKNFE